MCLSVIDLSVPFIILALPRSRTKWLSSYLSCFDWYCGHDELRHMRGLDDVRSWLSQPKTGTVETLAAPWWRLIMKYRPDIRVIVIRRPVEEVVNSLMAMGHFADRALVTATMRKLDAKLSQIEKRIKGAVSIPFRELARQDICSALFEYCLGVKEPEGRWAQFDRANIQCSMPAMIRYADANQMQISRLSAVAKQISLSEFARETVIPPDGIIFAQESFEEWKRDGRRLFDLHAAAVGETPEAITGKNWALAEKLASLGNIQIVTARSNGRMFGYLMTILCPSMEAENVNSAIHTTFFASPEFRGLGLKLQRYALESLRERGIDEIFWRAGPRGDGPRMGPLYRRLGASPDGELYRLNLRGA